MLDSTSSSSDSQAVVLHMNYATVLSQCPSDIQAANTMLLQQQFRLPHIQHCTMLYANHVHVTYK